MQKRIENGIMTKIVADTNVIISSVLKKDTPPSQIMERVYNGEFLLYYSNEILSEYKRVLSYPKFNFPDTIQRTLINTIEQQGILVRPAARGIPMPDPSDRPFYDTAREAGAILITGNDRHYPRESFIMTPTIFLEKVQQYTG